MDADHAQQMKAITNRTKQYLDQVKELKYAGSKRTFKETEIQTSAQDLMASHIENEAKEAAEQY